MGWRINAGGKASVEFVDIERKIIYKCRAGNEEDCLWQKNQQGCNKKNKASPEKGIR